MDVLQELAGWQLALLVTYAGVVLLALSRHLVCTYEVRRLTFLTPNSPKSRPENSPLVSIIVPAKDEAQQIESCLISLLKQDYPNFEILVIDDRSEDKTAEIVERLAETDERLRLVRIQHLPDGWTGKNHALHIGQEHARGDWFYFVDADTTQHESCLSALMRDCTDHKADMESALPALDTHSFWERVVQPYAATCLIILFPLSKVNDPKCKRRGFANGQFILVSRAAYHQIGGHEGVRDKFVEDIHLGRRIRRAGLGLRVVVASELTSVRMYSSLDDIVRGWMRILYSAVDCSPKKLYLLFAFICILSVLPHLIIWGYGAALLAGITTSFVKLSFAMGLIHEFGQLTLYARTYRHSKSRLRYLAFRWLAVIVMLYLLVKTIRMCRTHKVTWRGTTYTKELQVAA